MAVADREKALAAALAQIEKQHGKGSVMRLGDETRQPIEVIPTGSIADHIVVPDGDDVVRLTFGTRPVKVDNIGAIAAAGADTFVAGSAIFGSQDYPSTIAAMRRAIAEHAQVWSTATDR